MKNQPAFPTTQYAHGISPSGFDPGMTLRDYFAAKAMQGLLAHGGHCVNYLEKSSYYIADEMMKAREKK